jgi:hypothetical protein
LPVSARRNLASSVLFSVHPLLMLAPTDDFLDAPGDHPRPVSDTDWLQQTRFVDRETPCEVDGFRIETGWKFEDPGSVEGSEWCYLLVSQPGNSGPTAGPPSAARILLAVADSSDTDAECPAVMPKEKPPATAPTTCPYRPSLPDPHARLPVCPDFKDDVLANLDRVVEADRVMEAARALLREGFVREAVYCYGIVCRLVPGSRLEAEAAEAMDQLVAQIAEGCETPEIATEEQEAGPPGPGCDPSEFLQQIRDEWEHALSVLRSIVAPGSLGKLQERGPQIADKPTCESLLSQPISATFAEMPLKEVLDRVQDLAGVTIDVDKRSLDEAGVSLDGPVTVQLDAMSLKSVLNMLLRPLHLTYVVKDKVLQITTEELHKGRGSLRRAVYAVADLVKADPDRDAEALIHVIVAHIEPNTWNTCGGSGAIDYFPAKKALIISQTLDVQEQVADLLAALRRVSDLEGSGGEQAEDGTVPNQDVPRPLPEGPKDPDVQEEVSGLIQACRLAAEAGQRTHAAELAGQAHALDEVRALADPVVREMYQQFLRTHEGRGKKKAR